VSALDRLSTISTGQHTARGATKEKSSKLAELKAKRKAKDERKRVCFVPVHTTNQCSPSSFKHSSPKRDRSSSPMDMEISDGESEDGQITKFEQEEEKVGRIFDKRSSDSEPVTHEDVEKCRLTRDLLAKHALAPWYEDYVKGSLFVGCHETSHS
jgi:RNA polymerase-associated protein RTF1